MIHIGQHKGSRVYREEAVHIPIPERTNVSDRWKGVSHGDLIAELDKALDTRGLSIKSETIILGDERQTMYGSLDIRGVAIGEGMQLNLAYRHSNISKYSVAFFVGATVLVCSNGMVAFDQGATMRRKHTTGMDLADTVGKGVDGFLDGAERIPRFVDALKGLETSDDDAAKYLIAAGRRGILPWSSIGRVDKLWQKPTFEDFAPRNRWSLYNDFTEVIRDRAPLQQIPALAGLRDLINRPPSLAERN